MNRRHVFVHRGHALDDTARALLGDGAAWTVVNLSSNIFAAEQFPAAVRMRPGSDVLLLQDLQEIHAEARTLAKAWHLAIPDTLRRYKDVDLTTACEYEAIGELLEAVKGIRFAERLAGEGVESIAIAADRSPFARAVALVAQRHGIAVRSSGAVGSWQPHATSLPVTLGRVLAAKGLAAFIRVAGGGPDRPASTLRLLLSEYFRFEPLIADLSADARVQVYVVGGGAASALQDVRHRRAGVRHPVLTAGLGLGRLAAIRRYRRALSALRTDDLIQHGPRFGDYAILDCCRPWVEHQLRTALPSYAAFLEMADSLLTARQITHVIVNQDTRGEHRVLAIAAKRRGVRTICYQHGLTVDSLFPPHVSDTYAAWGEREVAAYKRVGRDTALMRPLGDPFLSYLKTRRFDRLTICRQLGLDPTRPIVLMTCERFVNITAPGEWPTTPNERLRRVCEAVAGLPAVQLLVRFKAAGAYGEYGDSASLKAQIIERYNRHANIHIDGGGNLYERLFVSAAAIVTYSTVGVEALLFGKPIFVLTEPGIPEVIEYVSSGVAEMVSDVDDIRRAIGRAVRDPACGLAADVRRRFLEWNFINLPDPDPLARVRQFLLHPSSAEVQV